MSTRVLREKVKAQEAELIGLYQENAKLKVLVATDYHKLSNGERESLINTLEKMQGARFTKKPTISVLNTDNLVRMVSDNSFLSSAAKLMDGQSVPSKDRMFK